MYTALLQLLCDHKFNVQMFYAYLQVSVYNFYVVFNAGGARLSAFPSPLGRFVTLCNFCVAIGIEQNSVLKYLITIFKLLEQSFKSF